MDPFHFLTHRSAKQACILNFQVNQVKGDEYHQGIGDWDTVTIITPDASCLKTTC